LLGNIADTIIISQSVRFNSRINITIFLFDKKLKIVYNMTKCIHLVIFFMETKSEIIIKAGIKLFSKYWIKRTSVDQIVEDASIAKGTFYLYFKNKEELYEKIILDKFASWEKCLNKALSNIDGIKLKIVTKMMISLQFFERDDIMRNILFQNRDYETLKINKSFIEKLHLNLLKPIFENNDNLDYNLISKIMWFYVYLINMKTQFDNEEEYNKFSIEFAWIIVNWIFSDYKELLKNYKEKKLLNII